MQAGYLLAWRQWLPCRQPVTARGALLQRLSGVRPFNFLQQAERHFQAIFTGDKRPEEAVLVIAFGDEAGLKPGLIARISAATGLALIRSEHGFTQRAAGA